MVERAWRYTIGAAVMDFASCLDTPLNLMTAFVVLDFVPVHRRGMHSVGVDLEFDGLRFPMDTFFDAVQGLFLVFLLGVCLDIALAPENKSAFDDQQNLGSKLQTVDVFPFLDLDCLDIVRLGGFPSCEDHYDYNVSHCKTVRIADARYALDRTYYKQNHRTYCVD